MGMFSPASISSEGFEVLFTVAMIALWIVITVLKKKKENQGDDFGIEWEDETPDRRDEQQHSSTRAASTPASGRYQQHPSQASQPQTRGREVPVESKPTPQPMSLDDALREVFMRHPGSQQHQEPLPPKRSTSQPSKKQKPQKPQPASRKAATPAPSLSSKLPVEEKTTNRRSVRTKQQALDFSAGNAYKAVLYKEILERPHWPRSPWSRL